MFCFLQPLWEWHPRITTYQWKSQFYDNGCKAPPASLSIDNWGVIKNFLLGLQWRIHPHDKTSFLELAFAFHFAGLTLTGVPNTPAQVSTLIRKSVNHASHVKSRNHAIVPCSVSTTCKSNGKVHCSGHVSGASAYIPVGALMRLAVAFGGRTRRLSEWTDFE